MKAVLCGQSTNQGVGKLGVRGLSGQASQAGQGLLSGRFREGVDDQALVTKMQRAATCGIDAAHGGNNG